MNRRFFQFAMWLPWVTAPVIAAGYWMAWDRLPARMATHFNAAGQANGWMTREMSMVFGAGILLLMLAIFSGITAVVLRKRSSDTGVLALLVLLYWVIGILFYANLSILSYNLTGQPVEMNWAVILTPIVVLLFMALYLASQRGKPLQSDGWMAEEVHASPFFAAVFVIPLLTQLVIMSRMPSAGMQLGSALLSLLFVLIAVQAWTGFHYRFGQAGVEISTLGFRLRSIPVPEIEKYGVEKWSWWRGYGIRGVGDSRAYVWGNKVVHITTTAGDVFLGHNDPERVVRDLDMIAGKRAG
jgi:hypothetical protein